MRARLDAVTVAITDRFDGRSVWAGDGARNTAGWVTARAATSYGRARGDVDLARELRTMPHVTAAFGIGRLTREQVQILVKSRQPGLEDAFRVCEQLLVDEIAESTLRGGSRYLRRWALTARERLGLNDPDGPEPTDGTGPSRVHLSQTFEGRWVGTLDLEGEDGEIIFNALDHQVEAMWRDGTFTSDDGLTPAEHRAVALVELIRRGTNGGEDDSTARPLILAITNDSSLVCPTTGDTGCACRHSHDEGPSDDGDLSADTEVDLLDDTTSVARPSPGPDPTGGDSIGLAPNVDPGRHDASSTEALGSDTLGSDPWLDPQPVDDDLDLSVADAAVREAFGAAMVSELSRSGTISPQAVRRLACEGDVLPVVVGTDGEPLDMGRRIRIANRAQRRALRIRDGGCVVPGCSAAPEHCVAHHLVWWERDGRTDLPNLALVCRFHHKLIHQGRFHMARGPDGTIEVTRADRSPPRPALDPRPDRLASGGPPPRRHRPITPADREEADLAHHARRRIRALIDHQRGFPVRVW